MKYKNILWIVPIAIVGATTLTLIPASHGKDADASDEAVMVVVDHDRITVPEHSPLRARLQVAAVTPTETEHAIVVAGQVDANPTLTVNVLPPLTGRVVDLAVQLGDRVRKGQLLATIASGDMAQAQSDADKARDALDLAVKQRDRTRGVGEAGGAATKDIEAADSGVTQAQAELTRAETRLRSLGAEAGAQSNAHSSAKNRGHLLTLTSPSNGIVTTLNVGQGGYVDDPTATMMTITDISSVYVTAWVPEDQIAHIAQGQDAGIALSAYPGEVLRSRVKSISNVMAPDTRRLPVRMVFDNPNGHLIPNMYANVSFKVPQPPQVIIPQSALLMNNDSTTVFVEVAPWTFVRRAVELSYDESANVRVVSGLTQGDRVLVKGGVLIND